MTTILMSSALIAVLIAPLVYSQEGSSPTKIADGKQNIRPMVSYNPDDNQFIVVWIQTNDSVIYSRSSVYAAILSADTHLKITDTKKISRPSLKKIQAPFVAVQYHPLIQKYLILWQEIEGADRTLYLTSLDRLGEFSSRSSILDENEGVLITAPMLGIRSDSENVVALWCELAEGGPQTTALIFNAESPHFRVDPRYVVKSPGKRSELPMALNGSGPKFSVYGFLADKGKGMNRYLFVKDLSMTTGLESGRTLVTRRNVRASMTLSAADGIDGDLLLYNQSSPLLNLSSLSIFNFDPSAKMRYRPSTFTPPSVFAFEGLLLDPATDGYNKLIWIKEDNNRYSVVLQSVMTTGDLMDDAIDVYTSRFPISSPVAVYGKDNASLLVVWSHENRKQEINLEGILLDLH